MSDPAPWCTVQCVVSGGHLTLTVVMDEQLSRKRNDLLWFGSNTKKKIKIF